VHRKLIHKTLMPVREIAIERKLRVFDG
jgi:hypothetical protein